MEIFLLSCILRELLQPKFLPQAPCLCLFKENVPRTTLEVSFHLNCVVKPRQMLLLMVSVREANEIIWIETARGVTDLSGSMAGREGCSPSRSFGAKPLSMLHQHILYRLFSRHQGINYVYPHVCYPHITNKLYCSRELVENHLQWVHDVRHWFCVCCTEALNELVIDTVFSVRCITQGYKYSVWVPLIPLLCFFV